MKILIERIDAAIKEFVEKKGSVQNHISLPEKEFQEFRDYVNSTELGRQFAKNGLAYCTLPVTVNTGDEILIFEKIAWC